MRQFGLSAVDVDRTLLPASLRRRSSLSTQMAVTAASLACEKAGVDPSRVPSVFASIGGEIQVTDELCRFLPDISQSLSPTRFHNSVHNTTAGYWGILQQCRKPSIAVAALDDTFAIGLLEACSQVAESNPEILLVCYDELWPQYLAPPIGSLALSSALIVSLETANSALADLSAPRFGPLRETFPTELEELMQRAPLAACIPLLQSLNQPGSTSRVRLSPGPSCWYSDIRIR